MLSSIQNVKFIKVSKLNNVFHRCLCSTSYHVKHYLCLVSEGMDENKILFFFFFFLEAVLKGVLFRKPFACT